VPQISSDTRNFTRPLRLAISDDAGDDELGIVEHGPERVAERIAQLAALVDRARALRRCVAGNTSGKRELKKKLLQPDLVLADDGIDLAVRSLQIRVGHDGRTAMTGAGDVDHVEVVFLDDPIEVNVDEVLALLTYVWGKMTTEAGSVKGVLMAVGVAKLEEETHG